MLAVATTVSTSVLAGGLLTNTNQNIAFNRNFAREATIGIDGVYSNPAGVMFLNKGFHLSLNFQNVYQTRSILSGMTVKQLGALNEAALQQTPFYQPFKLNGGDAQGRKEYVGKASVPILPSFQAAYNTDKWSFQAGFALVGGGGKASFNDGLGSFERPISMIPALLYSKNLGSTTPGYSFDSYLSGHQYIFGMQLGAAYKINENVAVYGGVRVNYVWNKYEGSITNISANINGTNYPLHEYFGNTANALETQAKALRAQAQTITDPTTIAKLTAGADQAEAGAKAMRKQQGEVQDKHLESTQTGWGVTPIIGVDVKLGKWNLASKFEFNTHLNIQNDTKRDDTGMFKHGVNTPNDIPALLTLGAQYEITPEVRVMTGWHHYFDKSAKMANDKQKLLKGDTNEFLLGAEWDVTDKILVSAGTQLTRYGLGNGAYLNDMSFVTSSYSIGFGAKFQVAKNMHVNVAYFWTNYEKFNKTTEATLGAAQVVNTDEFTRTNKVFGVGLDITF